MEKTLYIKDEHPGVLIEVVEVQGDKIFGISTQITILNHTHRQYRLDPIDSEPKIWYGSLHSWREATDEAIFMLYRVNHPPKLSDMAGRINGT